MGTLQAQRASLAAEVTAEEASLVVQGLSDSVVKNPPARQEMQVRSLGREDPLEEGNGNPLQDSGLESPHGQRSLEVSKQSDTMRD